ncbi:hypothetical protein ACHAW5_009810 [Stephanodiscus triporus]|uniref:Uncharacterized protein n=1 Tax=Stephanodiscus triporus TaxID=2934178 RepID=A0ABD3PN16_9STRA
MGRPRGFPSHGSMARFSIPGKKFREFGVGVVLSFAEGSSSNDSVPRGTFIKTCGGVAQVTMFTCCPLSVAPLTVGRYRHESDDAIGTCDRPLSQASANSLLETPRRNTSLVVFVPFLSRAMEPK